MEEHENCLPDPDDMTDEQKTEVIFAFHEAFHEALEGMQAMEQLAAGLWVSMDAAREFLSQIIERAQGPTIEVPLGQISKLNIAIAASLISTQKPLEESIASIQEEISFYKIVGDANK